MPAPPPGAPPGPPAPWGNASGNGRPAPGQPAGPPRPTSLPEPSVRQRALAAFFLGGLSVLAALLGVGSNPHRGIYLVLFALVVGVAACWLAVSAMQEARRAASMRPRGAVFATVLGVLGTLLSVIMLIAFAVFWQQLTTFNQCISSANTLAAQQQCLNQVHKSLNGEISKLGARG
jgi:predicted PurR-regulated permease PerM